VKQVFAGRPILELRTARAADAMRLLDEMPEVERTSLFGTAVHVVLRSAGTAGDVLVERLGTDGIRVDSVEAVSPSLEDVFLDVVDRAEQARRMAS
jgi:ABC-2 type transport system ATP-binding protein